MSLRKLKYHEQKLLKKVDFLQWKSDQVSHTRLQQTLLPLHLIASVPLTFSLWCHVLRRV